MSETRQEQYLRILTGGMQKTQSDYEALRYLIEKGYAKGDIDKSFIISNGKNDYGTILAANWKGATADGKDHIEWLKLTSYQRFWHKHGGKIIVSLIIAGITGLFKLLLS